MLFRYSEVSQPNHIKESLVKALALVASGRLQIPVTPRAHWFREDQYGPRQFECSAKPAGFVNTPDAFWIEVDCSGRWLCYVALHEIRHVKQRWDFPEDVVKYSSYPEGLKQRIEDTADAFASSYMAHSDFMQTILPYEAIGGF